MGMVDLDRLSDLQEVALISNKIWGCPLLLHVFLTFATVVIHIYLLTSNAIHKKTSDSATFDFLAFSYSPFLLAFQFAVVVNSCEEFQNHVSTYLSKKNISTKDFIYLLSLYNDSNII